jgi:hypothetical protein
MHWAQWVSSTFVLKLTTPGTSNWLSLELSLEGHFLAILAELAWSVTPFNSPVLVGLGELEVVLVSSSVLNFCLVLVVELTISF